METNPLALTGQFTNARLKISGYGFFTIGVCAGIVSVFLGMLISA